MKPVFIFVVQYLFENDNSVTPASDDYDNLESARNALGNIVAETSRGALLHASISRRFK